MDEGNVEVLHLWDLITDLTVTVDIYAVGSTIVLSIRCENREDTLSSISGEGWIG